MAEKLKIIPLGGLNEIGKNMTAYEYGGEIIVVDCGMAFPPFRAPAAMQGRRADGCVPVLVRPFSGAQPWGKGPHHPIKY